MRSRGQTAWASGTGLRVFSLSELAPRAHAASQSVLCELQNAFNVHPLNASKYSEPQPEKKLLPLEDASFPTISDFPKTDKNAAT